MSDDTAKRDYRDRNRINIHEDYELRYWTKELGVTPEKLKQTIEKVGVSSARARHGSLSHPNLARRPARHDLACQTESGLTRKSVLSRTF
jgi:hypothetical protein